MKIKVLLLIFINTFVLTANDYNFNNNYIVFKNNETFVDSSYLYFSDMGCSLLGLKTNEFDLVFKEVQNDSISYRKVTVHFLNTADSLINLRVNENINKSILIENSDSIIHNENYVGGEKINYLNLYPNSNLELQFESNKFNYILNTFGYVNNFKFKIDGLDSIKYNIMLDSNINCYINNKKFIIPKLSVLQIDTLNDTTYINAQYIVSNDTISVNIPYQDSTKFTQVYSKLFDHTNNNNPSFIIESENYELNDSILYTYKNENCEITFYSKDYYTNDYLRNLNLNQNYKYPTIKKCNLNYKYTKNEYLVIDRIVKQIDSSDTLTILKIKNDLQGNLLVLLKTNKKIQGEFDSTLADSINFNFIPNAYHNNVLTKISNYGELHSSYYLNFYDSLFYNNKLDLVDFIINNYDIYFVGSCIFNYYDTLYNLNLQNNFNKNSMQKGVIFKFNTYYNMLLNNYFIGHNLNSEYLHFNSILSDNSELDGKLTIGGITNSNSILDTNHWIKSTNNSDNIIISFNNNLDSINNVLNIGGSGEEKNTNHYSEITNYLFSIQDQYYFMGETNSPNFDGDSIISNIRDYDNSSTFICNFDKNFIIKKVLFLESNLNNSLNDVAFSNNKIAVNIKTKSNIFKMADSSLINPVDSVSTTTIFDKIFIAIIDYELFFKNSINTYEYLPEWTSYIESSDQHITSRNIYFDEELLKVNLNTKSKNLILVNNYNLNNNNNNFENDGCLLKINFILFY